MVSSAGCRWGDPLPLLIKPLLLWVVLPPFSNKHQLAPSRTSTSPRNFSSQQPPMSNMANRTGLATPLVQSQQPPVSSQTGLVTPLVPTQQGSVSSGRGWSTSIQGHSYQSVNVPYLSNPCSCGWCYLHSATSISATSHELPECGVP